MNVQSIPTPVNLGRKKRDRNGLNGLKEEGDVKKNIFVN